ncbi:2-phosphosulfolactate phosphatase [Alkalihalobacillus sp. BA299]|uniref:2-phosphosulfolactate phosphatase n=1 Tax=Alkalihalobacillus sp. BA299 TaxID=2815938 RepID=UPI001ADA6D3F|nr:2-phosphosulfolactate phosphatase [Alkalihalobacillus sp. BA299]
MRKIQVITQKELVDSSLIKHCTAVVIDVFLATSTITCLVENGFKPVYAVKDAQTALDVVKEEPYYFLLMGELNGEGIENFQYPDPTLIAKPSNEQAAIICSTNGTIAVENAKNAVSLYVSSLLNGHRVAEEIHLQEDDSSIVIVCSGNAGRFSMEDFVGAGHIIEHLMAKGNYQLSDAAKLARDSYLNSKSIEFQNLLEGETANLLVQTGYGHTSQWVIDHFETMDAVPIYQNGSFVCKLVRESK